jgi:DNA-binding CsgD family transcriptional regulator
MTNRPVIQGSRVSPSEVNVLLEIAKGGTKEEVAARMFLSVHTVKTHVRRATARMGATNTAHLIALAIAKGVIPADAALDKEDSQ